MSEIPAYIQKQLPEAPPGKTGRHDAWGRISLQMKGEGIPDDVAFAELRRWIPDADKSDKELWDLIRGAEKRNPQPATTGGNTGRYQRYGQQAEKVKPKPYTPTDKSES